MSGRRYAFKWDPVREAPVSQNVDEYIEDLLTDLCCATGDPWEIEWHPKLEGVVFRCKGKVPYIYTWAIYSKFVDGWEQIFTFKPAGPIGTVLPVEIRASSIGEAHRQIMAASGWES